MAKDTTFYNNESAIYSAKRYPAVARTYVQHFFKKRLSVLIGLLQKRYAGKSGLNLLEVGCADGVVLIEIDNVLGDTFSDMTGIDIAEEMIRVARARTETESRGKKIGYSVRGQETAGKKYDVIIEVGVANYANFDEELVYAAQALKPGGRYFLSIAGTGSTNDSFGRGKGYTNFLSYAEYEAKIRGVFNVEEVRAVGLYIPLIWALPAIARPLQALVEAILAPIAPGLFHEKIYVLKRARE